MAKAPAKKAAAKAPAAPKAKAAPRAPRKDKAGRPTPPDGDGDGNSGGSLKGHHIDEKAKGSAQHALAVADLADDGLATIILPAFASGNRAVHSLGVNGSIRHLKIGVEVQVNAEELAVLEASNVDYQVVVPLGASASDAAAVGVEGSSSAADAPVQPPVVEEQKIEDESGAGAGSAGEADSGEAPAEATTATEGAGEDAS
jgi:hypothetical protein